MKRGVGFCTNVGSSKEEGCEDYAKGVFLLNHGELFHCPRCRKVGRVEPEAGAAVLSKNAPFKEVRVEFNYCSMSSSYREIAIVRDEAVWGIGGKYTLSSPLIKTEKRALKVAEALLANLQHSPIQDVDDIPSTTEIILSFDDELEDFTRKLKQLASEWEKSSLSSTVRRIPYQG